MFFVPKIEMFFDVDTILICNLLDMQSTPNIMFPLSFITTHYKTHYILLQYLPTPATDVTTETPA